MSQAGKRPETVREKLARGTDRVAGVLLVLIIAAASSIALAPGLFAQRVPYGEADLGSVAGATLKATRAYEIADAEKTKSNREEAVAAVRAVYAHDAAALEGALQRIRDGFRLARELGALQAAGAGGALAPQAIGAGSGSSQTATAQEAARADIERALGVNLEAAEFAALLKANFSEEAEEAVATLVARAMREMVVGDREELAQHRDRGIAIVRRAAGGKLADEVLSDVSGIRDLARVREGVDADALERSSAPAELRKALASLARREIRVNLKYDPELTRQRREDAAAAVKPVIIHLQKGEKVIGDGERIEERHLVIFQGMRAQSQSADVLQVRLGGALLAALLVAVLLGFAAGIGRLQLGRKDWLLLGIVLAGTLLAGDLWIGIADILRERTPEIPVEAWTHMMPLAAAAMLVRFVLGAEAALLLAVGLAALAGVLAGNSLPIAAMTLVGGIAGAARIGRARDRAGVFRAGLVAGLAQAVAVIAFALFAGKIASWDVPIGAAAALLGGALFAPVLVMSLLPLVEGAFGYSTDLRLLELANLNHPALKELIVQAPGTYHHSIIVGTLVEGAAETIGANPLLAKVCAYYHDLGKGKTPLYFGENQKGNNRHDDLPPEESARLIIEHVSRGVEVAKKYKLPKQVIDAIPQHHGTRLVGYFYHKALKAHEAGGPPVDPAKFRYAGPRPQTRECALIMMADAAEAASRALNDPAPEKLQALVRKLIDGICADGQLDECDLTMRDLTEIAASFCRTLEAIYHSRPEYPAAAKGSQAQLEAAHRQEAGAAVAGAAR